VTALVLAVAGYYKHRTGSVYHPGGTFLSQPAPQAPAVPVRMNWPVYGFTKDHTRFFPASSNMHPPFKPRWTNDAHALLEFPPVIAGGRIFQLADDGTVRAVDHHTGATVWQRRIGTSSASTPAIEGQTVIATVYTRPDGGGGRVIALSWWDGHVLWSRDLPSPSESSPLVDRGAVFFGSQNGTVYALYTHTGAVKWAYHAAGAVKASPTLADGKLIFGDYSGAVQAIWESNGTRAWSAQTNATLFGSGTFYSTAAVRYGRVFLGNTDGRVYAFDADTGRLDWAYQTGAYVYSSPAVTDAPGLGPTVYVGSYDGNVYALDARSGSVDWSYDTGGKVSGGVTILGRILYVADLGHYRTVGLGVSTGRLLFQMHDGSFDSMISDGRNVYLTGYSKLIALAPRTPPPPPKPAAPAAPATPVTVVHLPPLPPAPWPDSSRCPTAPLATCIP
jgi:outer membrane protein assembly factor BamB